MVGGSCGDDASGAAHIRWGDQSRAITWSYYYMIFLCFFYLLFILDLWIPSFWCSIYWDWLYYLNIMHIVFLFQVIHIYIILDYIPFSHHSFIFETCGFSYTTQTLYHSGGTTSSLYFFNRSWNIEDNVQLGWGESWGRKFCY